MKNRIRKLNRFERRFAVVKSTGYGLLSPEAMHRNNLSRLKLHISSLNFGFCFPAG